MNKLIGISILLAVTLAGAQVKEGRDTRTSAGPGHYQILSEIKNPIIIPFKMHYGKPLMELEINDQPATLMIDNGVLWDEVWLFGSPLVGALQLKPIAESSIEGAGESDPTQAYSSQNLTLKFSPIIFYEQPVLVSPLAAGFAKMFPGADGQLCNTFFKHFIVEFDFIQNQIILHSPEQFKYPTAGSLLEMQANASGTFSIPFSLTLVNGKTYTDWVDIDLGGIYPLKIALNNKNQIQIPTGAQETFSYGAQGKASEYRGKIQSLTLGKYTFENPTVIFGDEKTSRIHPDNLGVIGLPLFMKFKIIFDYFNNRLYLEPNQTFETGWE